MKRLLLFIAALLTAGYSYTQNCSDLFISEYVEGWYNNKALEIYNPTGATITLDGNYRLIRWDNGKTTSDTDPLYVLPLTGSIDAFKVMVIIQDTTKPGQDTMVWATLRAKGTWLAPYDYGGTTPGGNCVFWNGDDAVSLQKKLNNGTWSDIDIFGEIGVRPLDYLGGTTGAWTDTKPYWRGTGAYLTKDQSLIRKRSVKLGIDRIAMSHYGDSTTGIYPNSFYAFAEYDSMPANFFDSLGFHTCDCKSSSGIHQVNMTRSLQISPNPVTNGEFTIQSGYPVQAVEIISLLGETIYSQELNSNQVQVRVSVTNQKTGVYFVRVHYADNQVAVKKVIFQ